MQVDEDPCTGGVYNPIQSADLSLISGLGILNFSSFRNKSRRARLKRDVTFPAALRTNHPKSYQKADLSALSWGPRQPSSTATFIWIKLGQKIGEGGSGLVYSVYLRSPTTLDIPDCLCIKISKPLCARALAREAWFYEQLNSEKLDGIITPRCFGFFCTERNRLDHPEGRATFPPWRDIQEWPEMLHKLRDDRAKHLFFYENDIQGRSNSRWLDLQKCNDRQYVAVLLLERMESDFDPESGDVEAIKDMQDIMRDLSSAGIQHTDLRFNNFMRPYGDSPQQPCSRHKRIHSWRLIDLEHSNKWHMSEDDPSFETVQVDAVDLTEPYFIGAIDLEN